MGIFHTPNGKSNKEKWEKICRQTYKKQEAWTMVKNCSRGKSIYHELHTLMIIFK